MRLELALLTVENILSFFEYLFDLNVFATAFVLERLDWHVVVAIAADAIVYAVLLS